MTRLSERVASRFVPRVSSLAYRIAVRALTAFDSKDLRDGFPHLRRPYFDLKTVSLDPELTKKLDAVLDLHDDFNEWLSRLSVKDYVSDSDYRKIPTMKAGMVKALREALGVAREKYGSADWSDVDEAIGGLSGYDIGRPPKLTLIPRWNNWLYAFHDALSAIANRSDKEALKGGRSSSVIRGYDR